MLRKRIIIAHGYWGRGGAEIATMHLIDAIKDKFRVYLITRGGWNLDELNIAAGTKVLSEDIKLVRLPFSFILRQTKGGHLWHAVFLRYIRYIAKKFDIRVTASRVMGWGEPAIHFLSDVVWNKDLEIKYEKDHIQQSFLKKVFSIIGEKIAGRALNELHKDDIFIANSRWTAKQSSPHTTTEPIVINPPVNQEFECVPWQDRLNHFVSFGRISAEKKIEDSIEIIEGIRALGYNIELTIFGKFDGSSYAQGIKNKIKNKKWIHAPGPIYGDEKSKILPKYKYGINTCHREAFGISTAEMLKAGIITFVPFEGAQQEIVNSENLSFLNVNDGIIKIKSLLDSELITQNIIKDLQERKNNFSKETFRLRVLSIFKNYNL